MVSCCVGKALLLLAILLATTGSATSQSRSPAGDARARGGLPPDENPQFFPTEVFGSNRSIMARGYSWYFRSMGEKPLAESVSAEIPQVYRVLVEVRPYNSPVVVRLSIRADGLGELAAKVGRDGGHPDILTVNGTSDVSRLDVDRFLKLLDDADFWSMPTRNPSDLKRYPMGDTGWMLEASKDGRYHLVYRAASELGPLKDPAVFLVLSLAKVDLRSLTIDPHLRK